MVFILSNNHLNVCLNNTVLSVRETKCHGKFDLIMHYYFKVKEEQFIYIVVF